MEIFHSQEYLRFYYIITLCSKQCGFLDRWYDNATWVSVYIFQGLFQLFLYIKWCFDFSNSDRWNFLTVCENLFWTRVCFARVEYPINSSNDIDGNQNSRGVIHRGSSNRHVGGNTQPYGDKCNPDDWNNAKYHASGPPQIEIMCNSEAFSFCREPAGYSQAIW